MLSLTATVTPANGPLATAARSKAPFRSISRNAFSVLLRFSAAVIACSTDLTDMSTKALSGRGNVLPPDRGPRRELSPDPTREQYHHYATSRFFRLPEGGRRERGRRLLCRARQVVRCR